jgi:hypothetical protein
MKKGKSDFGRGRKQQRDKFRWKVRTIPTTKHTYFIELEIDRLTRQKGETKKTLEGRKETRIRKLSQ